MRPVEVSFPGGTQHRTVAPLCLGSSTFIHSPLIEQVSTPTISSTPASENIGKRMKLRLKF
uniref:Uncharacterized protein n=1 Tax=Aegilops tauschii subsp. strangulata TaxID=200361 RepID=A0A453MFH1_AEGTS